MIDSIIWLYNGAKPFNKTLNSKQRAKLKAEDTETR